MAKPIQINYLSLDYSRFRGFFCSTGSVGLLATPSPAPAGTYGEPFVAEYQWLINFLLGVGFAVAGWFGRQVWEGMKELRGEIKALEVSLPMKYTFKSDFQAYMQRQDAESSKHHTEIMAKLDTIDGKFNRVYDKLDAKADK